MDLQTAFYVISLVFMGLMLLLVLAVLVLVVMIRRKIHAILASVEQRLQSAGGLVGTGAKIVSTMAHSGQK